MAGALFVISVVGVGVQVLAPLPASGTLVCAGDAVSTPALVVGGFEIDGNLCTEPLEPGSVDWGDSPSVFGTVQPIAQDPIGVNPVQDTTAFTQGASETNGATGTGWSLGQTQGVISGGNPGSADVGNVYSGERIDAAGDVYTYFGFERRNGTGSVSFHAELNQKPNDDPACAAGRPVPNPCRTDGDLMLAFQQSGSDFSLGAAWRWSSGAWVPEPSLAGYTGAVNAGPVSNLSGESLLPGYFAEAAVNLTTLSAAVGCSPEFTTLNLRSASAPSLTASLVDWVVPIALDVPSTCPTVVLRKQWVGAVAGDTADLSVSDGVTSASMTSPQHPTSGTFLDPNTLSAEFTPGSTVTLSEVLGAGNGPYLSSLSCDEAFTAAPDGRSGTVVVPDDAGADTTITCTFTNTRSTVTLHKRWGTIADTGDTADLTITGGSTPAVATSPAQASHLDTANVAVTQVDTGGLVTVSEVVNAASPGDYATALACFDDDGEMMTTVAADSRSGSFTMPASPVTCEFINSTTPTVVLFKDWVGGALNDTADLSIDGASAPPGAATSTVTQETGPTFADVENAATADTTVGDPVVVSEVLPVGNAGTYASSLGCFFGGSTVLQTDGRTGSFTMPGGVVTCTFVNHRTVGVTLGKAWVGGVDADSVVLTLIDGGGVLDTATSTLGGAAGTASATVPSGTTVTAREDFDVSIGTYDPRLSCVDENDHVVFEGSAASLDFEVPAVSEVRCTFTNTRLVRVTLDKVWDGAVAGDTADLVVSSGHHVESVTSVAPGAATVVLDGVRVGSGVGVFEVLPAVGAGPNTGSYDSTLACFDESDTRQASPRTGRTDTGFDMPNASVNCTFTNRRDDTPEWTVTKSSDPGPGLVWPGDVITYTLTASELSGGPTQDAVVTDDLSGVLEHTQLVPGSIQTSAGSASLVGTTLTWTIATLSGDQTLTYQVTIGADASGAVIRNAVVGQGALACPTEHCADTTHRVRADGPSGGRLPVTGGLAGWLVPLTTLFLTVGAVLTALRRTRARS